MKGTVTKREFNGTKMLKFSQLPKNGKPQKMVYKFPAEFIKEINEEVASYKSKLEEGLAEILAGIKEIEKQADKVEMYESLITIAEQDVKERQEFKKVAMEMLPPPIAEMERRRADCVIAHRKSAIAHFKKELAVK